MDLLNDPNVRWSRFTDDRWGYNIDYWGTVLDVRGDHFDLAYRWEPDGYCHFHRHLAATTSTVVAGELHVTDFDEDGNETGTRVRHVGDYAHTAEPDVHMERGGPDGAVVLFNLYAPDGLLSDVLTTDLKIVRTIDAASLRATWDRWHQ